MKKTFLSLLMIFLTTLLSAQETQFIVLANSEQTDGATSVNAEGLSLLVVEIMNMPDVSKYDMVTANLYFPDMKNKYAAYTQGSGEEIMNLCKDSKKNPGAKYFQLLIANSANEKNLSYFKIDAYPFDKLSFANIFSRADNNNVESYTMEFQLTGQMIERYEEKWEDGVLKQIPIYGSHIAITKKITIKIVTSIDVAGSPKDERFGSPDDLKNMFE
ncbi:MAG: hypothetical protein JXR60_10320 [Bacteroidales bacterium]|nr:hypothetical protein [Bacteroidales bacterium]